MSELGLDGVPPGYYRNAVGGIESLPWPDDIDQLPPSLGFQVIDWCEANLVHHLDGTPWRFTEFQKKIIVLAYAVNDAGTAWLYRRVITRLAKGAGKDPFFAALIDAELMGPTKFSHFHPVTGRPVGVRHRKALVTVGANSETQAKELLAVANSLVSDHLAAEVGFVPGVLGSAAAGGSRIKLNTKSEATTEGDPATASFLNETHHMTEANGGNKIAATGRRNVAKSPGGWARVFEATNAHVQGGGSVGERTYESWQTQLREAHIRKPDILYVSVEASPELEFGDPETDMTIIRQAYVYSPWTNPERILAEVYDDETTLADAIRFFANGVAATATAWVEPVRFDALSRPELPLFEGDQISLFLDCSKSDDATALMACRISDEHYVQLGVWQKPHGYSDKRNPWRAPRHEVDAAVRLAKSRYEIVWFGVDPSPAKDEADDSAYWGPLVEAWHILFRDELAVWASPGRNAVEFDFRQSVPGGKERFRLFTEMCGQLQTAIDEDGSITHCGSAALRTHVHNARMRPNQWGNSIGKATRNSPHKVDLAVAMVAAGLGRSLWLTSGKSTKKSTGVMYQF